MNILCFGDSNTFGVAPQDSTRLSQHQRWPSLLQQYLGKQHSVVEAGMPNRTLVNNPPFDGEKSGGRYLKSYLDQHAFDCIVLMLGTNDLKHRFNLTAVEIADGLERLIKQIYHYYQPNGSPPQILIVSPPSVFEVGQYQQIYQGASKKAAQLGKQFARVALKYECLFLDCYPLISPCAQEGIHLPGDQHEQLAGHLFTLLAAKEG